jgi:hypothetical protein
MIRKLRRVLCAMLAAERLPDQPRPTPDISSPLRAAVGIIHQVDPVGRELTAILDGTCRTFYVPLDCSIVLNNERVKLRMLQRLDPIRIVYWGTADVLTARSITAPWSVEQASCLQERGRSA